MKKIVMMMFAACMAVGAMAADAKFKLSNMHCGGCAARAEKALKANDAVSNVAVDLESKVVTVTYDEAKVQPEALQAALVEAKFEVEPVKGCACGAKKEAAAEKKGCCSEKKDEAAAEKKGGCCGGGDKAEKKEGGCCGGKKDEAAAEKKSCCSDKK